MKTKEFAELGSTLARILPQVTVQGPTTFLLPIEQLLRGVYFEGSSFDGDSFFVTWFFIPLYVPTSILYFNHGGRIRKRSGLDNWKRADPALVSELKEQFQEQALPTLRRVETVGGAIDVLREELERSKGRAGSAREALGYALASTGEYDAAIENLLFLQGLLDLRVTWQKEISDRADMLMNKIKDSSAAVSSQLEEWTRYSVRKLNLVKLLDKKSLL